RELTDGGRQLPPFFLCRFATSQVRQFPFPAFLRSLETMKHVLLALLFPMALTAQTVQQLTEQLGKTVLYGDIALSSDGAHVAWVQSTAASTPKQTFVRETSGNVPAILIKIPISGERTDFDPAWAPDSKTLAVFSGAGE